MNQQIIDSLDFVLSKGDKTLATKFEGNRTYIEVDNAIFQAFKTPGLSTIKRILGETDPFYTQFESVLKYTKYNLAEAGVEMLKDLKAQVSNNWIFSIKGLVSAEIFTDFLDMAQHLLDEGYKDAAAVIIGSSLENHLKQLCQKHSIPTTFLNINQQPKPQKADILNSELKKAKVYQLLDQKQVTAWLGLRNDAAHGNYSNYTKEQVQQMHNGVLNFVSRTPI